MVLQEPGKMTRPISKAENLSRRIFFFSSESSDYKENYSAFVFLGHNTKLGPLGAVSTETWKFFQIIRQVWLS